MAIMSEMKNAGTNCAVQSIRDRFCNLNFQSVRSSARHHFLRISSLNTRIGGPRGEQIGNARRLLFVSESGTEKACRKDEGACHSA